MKMQAKQHKGLHVKYETGKLVKGPHERLHKPTGLKMPNIKGFKSYENTTRKESGLNCFANANNLNSRRKEVNPPNRIEEVARKREGSRKIRPEILHTSDRITFSTGRRSRLIWS